jgi:hypothetical protein
MGILSLRKWSVVTLRKPEQAREVTTSTDRCGTSTAARQSLMEVPDGVFSTPVGVSRLLPCDYC